MMQKIRDNASGPLAYVVVAVITLVFGVWGIGSYFTPSSDPIVATVAGQDIARSRLQYATQQLQQQQAQRNQRIEELTNGETKLPRTPLEQLRRAALEQIVDQTVMAQYADDVGYRVTDAGLLAAIRDNPAFQADNKFSTRRYRSQLARAGMAPAQYEANLRRSLTINQLRNEITESAFAAPAEVDQAYRLANQQRRLRYLVFDPASYRDAVEVNDSEIQDYYKQNGDQFKRPERVKLAYVSLDRASAAADADSPDEQTLRDVFEQNSAQFGEPERRSGALVRIPLGDDDSAARSAIQTLAAADGDLKTRANSNEQATYKKLDEQARKSLDNAVGESLFELSPGDTSTPVKGQDAWYLVHLDAVTPASDAVFDNPDVQARLKAMASTQQAQQAFADKSDRLESLAYEAPNDLKTLIDELGLKKQTTGWITQEQGEGIGQYDAVRKAAFSDAVVKDSLNSTPIQLGGQRRVVLRVTEHQAAERKPLDAVRDAIRNRVAARKASQKARDAAQAALEKATSGTSLEAISEQHGAALESPGFVRRANRDVDPGVLEAAFGLPKPDEENPGRVVASTRDGRIALLAVDATRESESDNAEKSRGRFAQQQRSAISKREFAVLRAHLRSRVDIEINENRIN